MPAHYLIRLLVLLLLILGCSARWCWKCLNTQEGCEEGGEELWEEAKMQCADGERCVWFWKQEKPYSVPEQRRKCGTMGPHRCGYSESDEEGSTAKTTVS
ncbi:unnamed protein product, partial [Mesorhabditis spiculigera]